MTWAHNHTSHIVWSLATRFRKWRVTNAEIITCKQKINSTMRMHVQRLRTWSNNVHFSTQVAVIIFLNLAVQPAGVYSTKYSGVPMAVDYHAEDCRGRITDANNAEVVELMQAAAAIACSHTSKCQIRDRNPNPLTFTMFCGHPRSGHSLVGSIIDSNFRAAVSNEYDFAQHVQQPTYRLISSQMNTTSRIEAHLFHILLNSRQCSKQVYLLIFSSAL